MAKTLVEFENELLDVMTLFRITRKQLWNEQTEQIEFCIIFNEDLPEKFLVRDLVFRFASSELRDKKMKELKNKIGELEHINIL